MSKIVKSYKINKIPDLSLDKYSSLDGKGVEGVLEKHNAFLRRWNRKGILSEISFHLFYYFDGQDAEGEYVRGERGNKLEIIFAAYGEEEKMKNIDQLVFSSPLSEYYEFRKCNFNDFLSEYRLDSSPFSYCAALVKKETFIRSSVGSGDNSIYYNIRAWTMNEGGRLYSLAKLLEALDKKMVYRVDLYPVDKGERLRDSLTHPMSVLRDRIYNRMGSGGQRDYEAEAVLKDYEELMSKVESSPHFIANVFVFANNYDDAAVVLDSAGSEAVSEGNYDIGYFKDKFYAGAFSDDVADKEWFDRRKQIVMKKAPIGFSVFKDKARDININYLSNLFTLEEIEPFFRFPALYDGETIQKRKETAPVPIPESNAIYLGTDDNGYPVYFPLEKLAKHAFIAGVPGSGKTNTLHHLTSTLWKKHGIPFLVFEPAKKEYRALANQEEMEDMFIFSPNADMRFPLHINPFEFPKGEVLSEHISNLFSVFQGSFELEASMPFLLQKAIEAVYRDLGWSTDTVYTDETNLKFPTMSMLYRKMEEEVNSTKYDSELRGNIETALKVRIGSLLQRELGDLFDVPTSTLSPEEWLEKPAVIELESIGKDPANFLTLLLCTLIRETLKVNPHYDKDYARHVIFIEEAHNLIGPNSERIPGTPPDPKQSATEFISNMLAEVRALKEGIVIADQLPTVMAPAVIKNTGLKIALRITASDDRGLLGSTMAAMPNQIEQMASFGIGRSLISYEGLMRPFTIQTHEWCGMWNTEHCSYENFDESWCIRCCEHFRNGECIPSRSVRKAVTTSKYDEDLQRQIFDRPSYRKICEKSFFIEANRINNKFMECIDRCKAVSDTIDTVSVEREKYNSLKSAYDIAVGNGESSVSGRSLDKVRAELRDRNDLISELTSDSGDYQNTVDIVSDFIGIADRIDNRLRYWERLGISDDGIYNGCENKENVKNIFGKIKERQKYAVEAACDIYERIKLNIEKETMEKLRGKLIEAAKKYQLDIAVE